MQTCAAPAAIRVHGSSRGPQAVALVQRRYRARVVRTHCCRIQWPARLYEFRLLSDSGQGLDRAHRCLQRGRGALNGSLHRVGQPGGLMRVLVVEDETALREALKAELAAAGFTVDLAADGEEGLYMAMEYPIDVAIIDLGLPKLSGLDLIRKLRARGKTYGVLILTARDRWQDKVEGLSAGADDYVAKPFHFARGAGAAVGAAAPRRRMGDATARLRTDRARHPRAGRHGAAASRWS